ncbi:hypothetical protein RF11_15092 [Thelohanellus kitauei]|uniref:Uncharacterized protein n=1 Tax=Thelohanellus kitauei TaxID=669202 RepID=A0A0C2MMN3_THEKT|nr:hypothetical protein RF11_15092 [Thelohanellus kitauei]
MIENVKSKKSVFSHLPPITWSDFVRKLRNGLMNHDDVTCHNKLEHLRLRSCESQNPIYECIFLHLTNSICRHCVPFWKIHFNLFRELDSLSERYESGTSLSERIDHIKKELATFLSELCQRIDS